MTSVAIFGTGFGGLAAAARLEQAGIDDVVLFEKAGCHPSAGGGRSGDRPPPVLPQVWLRLYTVVKLRYTTVALSPVAPIPTTA